MVVEDYLSLFLNQHQIEEANFNLNLETAENFKQVEIAKRLRLFL